MAKKKSDTSTDSGLEIEKVEFPEDGGDAEFAQEQARLYTEYKLTGVNRGWIDTTRDQEPDIAPEFGVAPHPELANPAPPSTSFSGHALNETAVPMVKSVEEKEEDGAEAVEAYNEYLQKRDELFEATANTVVTAAAQPVYMVDGPEESGVTAPNEPADGSQKNSVNATGADAQLPNASGFGTDPSGPKDAKSDSDSK